MHGLKWPSNSTRIVGNMPSRTRTELLLPGEFPSLLVPELGEVDLSAHIRAVDPKPGRSKRVLQRRTQRKLPLLPDLSVVPQRHKLQTRAVWDRFR